MTALGLEVAVVAIPPAETVVAVVPRRSPVAAIVPVVTPVVPVVDLRLGKAGRPAVEGLVIRVRVEEVGPRPEIAVGRHVPVFAFRVPTTVVRLAETTRLLAILVVQVTTRRGRLAPHQVVEQIGEEVRRRPARPPPATVAVVGLEVTVATIGRP